MAYEANGSFSQREHGRHGTVLLNRTEMVVHVVVTALRDM